ncbi:lipocalin-like domain-containing protein [Paraburkholderia caribensis]|nr:lipocalin-like domain-containing protein [Paraburkholderia caribensis]MCO4876970.1 lipocalin-like domain-containing protein [Paraburkholderia caribensis]
MKQLLYALIICTGTSMSLAASQVADSPTTSTLVGTWRLVSVTVLKSGSEVEILGQDPKGQLVLNSDGHYVLVGFRADLPSLGSGDRLMGTADENRRIVQGSLAHFGTYTVDRTAQLIVFHIQKGIFPNWDGQTQERPFTLEGDRLTYRTPGSFGYGASTVVWQRMTNGEAADKREPALATPCRPMTSTSTSRSNQQPHPFNQ